mgnify:FL=1|jgi:hypothetical protein
MGTSKDNLIDKIYELEEEVVSLQYDINWQNHYMDFLEGKNDELHHKATVHANYIMNSTKTYEL